MVRAIKALPIQPYKIEATYSEFKNMKQQLETIEKAKNYCLILSLSFIFFIDIFLIFDSIK